MNEPYNPEQEVPPRVALKASDDYGKYLLDGKTEIAYFLRALAEAHDVIAGFFNDSDEFMLTSLLRVDADTIVLDCSNNAATNRRALAARSMVCATSHDKIRIQFATPALEPTEFEGRPAFRTKLPDRLLRLQRREFYRLVSPAAEPVMCAVTANGPHGGKQTIEVQVLDLSAGGLAIVAPPSGIAFAVDQRFDDCRLELPRAGTIRATLRVRNIFEIVLRDGQRLTRYGCQFADLSGPSAGLIERYIMRIERGRKARQSGLA